MVGNQTVQSGVASNGMMFTPRLMEVRQCFQKLLGGRKKDRHTHTHTHTHTQNATMMTLYPYIPYEMREIA
jgi:hypothetical protein